MGCGAGGCSVVCTLWWQVRVASKGECGCRGYRCRTACRSVLVFCAVPFCFVLCSAASVVMCSAASCCAVGSRCGRFRVAGDFAVGTLWWQVRRKWSAGVGGFGLQFCFAVFCAVLCCAPLRHAAQWTVGAGGVGVGTLWWQVRRASKVGRGCRGCRTACTPVSFVNKRDHISVQFCLPFCACPVLSSAPAADSVLCIGRCTVVRSVVMKMRF